MNPAGLFPPCPDPPKERAIIGSFYSLYGCGMCGVVINFLPLPEGSNMDLFAVGTI